MWNATRKMAEAVGDGMADTGVDYKLRHAAASDRNDILADVFRARTIVLGSPTFNGSILTTMWPILHDLKGLKFKNKLGAAFGSYGWSGEAVNLMEKHFAECNIPLVREGIKCKWQPRASDLDACRNFGRELGAATKKGR
ncbi:MAG: anaerobic nitric oxide reductase flavorubredoxin, partial [Candidatus Hydrogenedentes bacterium]|nr:anaerobic nitric oxide reductase flavorubredoxin [Candidatus Hydrogenedentota bacterium]